MKKFSTNFKYITLSSAFIVVAFAFTQPVSADTYTYQCNQANGGGAITSVITIGPPNGPYSAGAPVVFSVTAAITNSTCTSPRTVNLTAQNNSGTVYPIITNSTLNPGGAIGPFTDSVHFASPSSAGSYAVHFITGVDEPDNGIYVKVTELSYQQWFTDGPPQCPQHGVDWYGHVHTTYRASFYSNAAATIPLNVTGLNLKLKQTHYIGSAYGYGNIFGSGSEETTYTSVLSGTSYDYDGYSYDVGETDQYGQSSCDTEVHFYGFSTLDGVAVSPTPYTLIPEAPSTYFNGPSAVYTGDPAGLNWSSQYATSCTSTPTNFTGGATSGSAQVTINGDTTFTVTCTNISGSQTKSLTVHDDGPPPPPAPMCNGYQGQIMCPEPGKCQEDLEHPRYEICLQ